MYYYWPYNDGIVDLDQIRIPVLWTELDVAFHSLGSEKAKGKGWVAPLFRGTAVVTEHGKDARRSPRKPSLAWRHLEAHAAQPASRANPNHYSHETRGRIEMPIDEVGGGSLPAKGVYGSLFFF